MKNITNGYELIYEIHNLIEKYGDLDIRIVGKDFPDNVKILNNQIILKIED